jgi:hypothetical protein
VRARSLLVGIVLWTLPASAADFWRWTKGQARASERETLQALHRAFSGSSDSIDELLVRTAMVDAARGKEYDEPLTLIYVLRMRRLLGLGHQERDLASLSAITEGGAPAETVALAAIELGRLRRLGGDAVRARAAFDLALGRAWQNETRIEAHIFRAFLALEEGDLLSARADFLALLGFDLGRSRLGLALTSLAAVELERGDVAEARRLFVRAKKLVLAGNTESGVGFVDRPELLPSDKARLSKLESLLESAGHGDEDDLDP